MVPIIENCKYFDGVGCCLATPERDPCESFYCPCNNVRKESNEEFYSKKVRKAMDKVLGVAPDAPVVENEHGGKQSDTPYAFHMLPTSAVFGAAEVCAYGAKKYGETIDNRNYVKIPTEEHVNHAIQHLYAYLAGDTQDDHLGHAIVRCMFAYDVAKRGEAS